jgi:hypothetical protein
MTLTATVPKIKNRPSGRLFFFKKVLDKLKRMCYNKDTKREERNKMINIRTIKKIAENGGLTLKNGKVITYKSGWQVADHGIEAKSAEEAIKAVRAMGGNCGIWLENGIYYIDHSFRVNTKREAMEIGRAHNQISVLSWRTMGLAYC